MHENENRVYIDVNEMADTLQRKYRDYRGKKRSAFRALVRKAYDELTEMFAKKSSRDWYAYEDDDDDDEVDVEVLIYVIFLATAFFLFLFFFLNQFFKKINGF